MELVFEATREFEADLARLGKTARRAVVKQLNTHAQFLLRDPKEFYGATLRPHKVVLREGFESTLYVLYSFALFVSYDSQTAK